LESELFGHEKGAFTGAIAQKIGRFELADRGTLFLDEVGDIPPQLQPKLLRVLQEQEFERLGSTHTHHVDVRLVAATNRDLAAMVKRTEFRADLYYRLNVFPISVPPLRERRDDIPALVKHFIDKSSRRIRKRIDVVPMETMSALMAYDWPGNIRELQNLIERAVILADDGVLPNSLPAPGTQLLQVTPPSSGTTLKDSGER
jgi:formate hydrogenlyase transcriptional activator